MVVVVVDKVQNLLPNAVVSSCLDLLGACERKKQYVMVQTMLSEMFGHHHQHRSSGNPSNQAKQDPSKVTWVEV